ncbi:hypothetical protein TrRE_jg7840 [Triparma retinervis]|uniref:Uncharacterized protein n=1 Tax=Triparma retinervis TaxID=2557542 RepID=A0A9W7ECW6_9STRA|nr:hypothetical protein TrRE_jg7840 [Triparma retinervis]
MGVMFGADSKSPPGSPVSSQLTLLPTTVIEFKGKLNNTRSDLALCLSGIPIYSFRPYLPKGAHFALNYTEEKDRALIEIPSEIAKTARRINEDLPPIPNFPLLFWFIQLTLAGVGVFFLASRPAYATVINVVLFGGVAMSMPVLILRHFVGSLCKEIKRLAHLHSETYYMRTQVQDFVWFWVEGGGFLTRADAFMIGLGVGCRIKVVVEVEYGPPKISDEKSKRENRRSGLERVEKNNKMAMMREQMTTERSMALAKIAPTSGGKAEPQQRKPRGTRSPRRGSLGV